jgi:hypothetical protein
VDTIVELSGSKPVQAGFLDVKARPGHRDRHCASLAVGACSGSVVMARCSGEAFRACRKARHWISACATAVWNVWQLCRLAVAGSHAAAFGDGGSARLPAAGFIFSLARENGTKRGAPCVRAHRLFEPAGPRTAAGVRRQHILCWRRTGWHPCQPPCGPDPPPRAASRRGMKTAHRSAKLDHTPLLFLTLSFR